MISFIFPLAVSEFLETGFLSIQYRWFGVKALAFVVEVVAAEDVEASCPAWASGAYLRP